MYYLSVGAIFKNESHSLKEWITHYLHHGVEHFYLINDNSSDNSVDVIKEYVDANIVTLFNVEEPYYLGRQRTLYNRHILPRFNSKETTWLLMVDIDEYVWSPIDINISNVLKHLEQFGQLQVRETIFGSNGHISQPNYLVKYFTKRVNDYSKNERYKYFVNSDYEFTSLNLHHADFYNTNFVTDNTKFIVIDKSYFKMNHYNCQSQEFWNNVKCSRGDADHYRVRNPEDFSFFDVNEVEDFELYNQNKCLYNED
jgi:hypothetical protein